MNDDGPSLHDRICDWPLLARAAAGLVTLLIIIGPLLIWGIINYLASFYTPKK